MEMHANNLVVCDAGDKRSNVQGRSHAMDAASERLVTMLHVS
jgi:hypothetical protein